MSIAFHFYIWEIYKRTPERFPNSLWPSFMVKGTIVTFDIQPQKLHQVTLSEFADLKVFPGWLIFCIGTTWLRSKMYLCVEVLQELKSCNQYQLSCNLQSQPIWKTFSKGMAMITQVVRFYYRFQKPSMIGLPRCFCCWQIALTRIFEAKYINAFLHARDAGGHVWMTYGCSGKHTRSWLQTLPDGQKLGNSTVTGPIWDSQKSTEQINVKWCQSKQLSGKWLAWWEVDLRKQIWFEFPGNTPEIHVFGCKAFWMRRHSVMLRKMWLFPWYYILFCLDLCYFMFPLLLEAG